MKHIFKTLLVLVFLFSSQSAFSQQDTVSPGMSFDFGFSRGHNIRLWPLLSVHNGKDKKEVDVLFKLYSFRRTYAGPETHSHLFPLYWHDSTAAGTNYRIGTTYYPSLINFDNNRLNKVRSYKFLDLAPEISLLEFTKSADGLLVQNNAFFFIWYKNNVKEKKGYFAVFPVYWSFRNGEKSSNTLFPLFSTGALPGRKKYLAVTPFFWHVGDSLSRRNILFPIYWSHKSRAVNNKVLFPLVWSYRNNRRSAFALFPLYYSRHTEGRKEECRAITPLVWHVKKGEKEKNILFPLIWNSTTGTDDRKITSNTVFPLYWSRKSKDTDTKVIFPFIWKLSSKDYSLFTLFPLFSAGHSSDRRSSHLAVTPLFWHVKDSTGSRDILFPLVWNRTSGTGLRKTASTTVFPVYFSSKAPEKDKKIVFPLVWDLKDRKYSSFTVFPFCSAGHSADGKSAHRAITPLFWQLKDSVQEQNILFPLVWNKIKGTGESRKTSTTVFPVYWSNKSKDGSSKVLFPIVWDLKDRKYSSFTFFPLFSSGHSADDRSNHLAVTPLFWHTKDTVQERNILFPLVWNRTSGKGDDKAVSNTVFPLYWSRQSKDVHDRVLFPLVWSLKDKQYSSFTFAPFFSAGHSENGKSKHLAVTPVFWHLADSIQQHTVVFPLVWNRTSGIGKDKKTSNTVFPLYFSYKDQYMDNKVLFPLVWSLKDKKYQSFSFIPFFSAGHSADGRQEYRAVTPLLWHFRDTLGERNVLFPLAWSKTSGTGENKTAAITVLPIYHAYKSKDEDNKIVFPLLWSLKNKKDTSITFFPFLSFGHSAVHKSQYLAVTPLFWHFKDSNSVKNILFPVWWNHETVTGEEKINTTIAFPLYWSEHDRNTDNKTLFPLVWIRKNKYYSSFTFFPVFSAGHSADHMREHWMLTPLLWHYKDRLRQRNILFPVYWSHTSPLFSSHTVFPLYWSFKSAEEKRRTVFPLLWSHTDKKSASFTFLPFYSEKHSLDHASSRMFITPLFRNIKSSQYHSTGLFPVFSYTAARDKKDFNLFYFLLRSTREKDSASTSFLWPLCKREKAPGFSYFRFAPVLWYKKSADTGYFSIQPFYLHRKTGRFEQRQVLWQLYSSKDTYGSDKSVSVLWKVYQHKVFANSDKEIRVLHRLYANVSRNGGTEKSLFPFYYVTKESNGSMSKSFLLSFYTYNKFRIANTSSYYQEQRIFWFLRLRSNFRYLKEKGIISSRKQTR